MQSLGAAVTLAFDTLFLTVIIRTKPATGLVITTLNYLGPCAPGCSKMASLKIQKSNYFTDSNENYVSCVVKKNKKDLSLQPPAHAGFSLADFSTLKMEAICSSETSVQFTRSTRRHITEDGIFQSS
jgi:hypothetical protein